MNSKWNSVAQVSFLLLAIGAMGIASGCGTSSTTTTPPPPELKNIYVTQGTGVSVFPIASTGNVAPPPPITDAKTAFSDAHRTAFDASGNIYVTDLGNSSVVEFAAGASGASTPLATIISASLVSPSGIAIDTHGNIYVTDLSNNTVFEFAAGATGNSTPTTIISGSNTQLDTPNGVALDSKGNIYVVNESFSGNLTAPNPGGSLTIYPAGSTGNATPSVVITGATGGISSPHAVALDSSGKIYVTNSAGSVNIYAAAPTANIAPIDAISGAATKLTNPNGIAVDTAGNIYVGNNDTNGADNPQVNNLLVFPAGSNGNVAPSAVISGASTGLASGKIHGVSLY